MSKYAFDGVRFAKDFHAERWGRGQTTRSMGEILSVSASTISRWERAKGEPPIVEFLHACGVLGLNPLDYIAKESELQKPLPGFEEYARGELVPLSQQDLVETLHLISATSSNWPAMLEGPTGPTGPDDSGLVGYFEGSNGRASGDEVWGDPDMPTKLTLEINGTTTIEVWHREIGWVLLPQNVTVEAWYTIFEGGIKTNDIDLF